jgi:alpha-galactosidase
LIVGSYSVQADEKETVRVFLLAGQSNMQGHGRLETGKDGILGGIGTLREQVNTNPGKYGHLVDGAGNWTTRSDVFVWNRNGTDTGKTTGDLGVTYGVDSDRIGPEVGFGKVVGDAFDDQVVLIKTAWGGKSLRTEFRPPSAVAKRGGVVGDYYTIMVDSINEALGDVALQFPDTNIQIEGLGWHQGFNDRLSRTNVDEYEDNLNDLIADLRGEFETPDMKVVIGTTSTGSDSFFDEANRTGNPGNAIDRVLDHVQAQKNVGLNDPLATTVDTRPFWRPADLSPRDQGFHWNQNGETMYLIGEEMGVQMVALVPEPSSLALLGLGGLLLTRRRRG